MKGKSYVMLDKKIILSLIKRTFITFCGISLAVMAIVITNYHQNSFKELIRFYSTDVYSVFMVINAVLFILLLAFTLSHSEFVRNFNIKPISAWNFMTFFPISFLALTAGNIHNHTITLKELIVKLLICLFAYGIIALVRRAL